MDFQTTISCILVISFLIPLSAAQINGADDVIKWQDMENITFHYGRFTDGRRGRPVHQVDCGRTFAETCDTKIKSEIRCHSKGISNESLGFPPLLWSCETDGLDSYDYMDVVEIGCECATDCADDLIIIKSCFVRYHVDHRARRYIFNFILVILLVLNMITWYFCIIIHLKTRTSFEAEKTDAPQSEAEQGTRPGLSQKSPICKVFRKVTEKWYRPIHTSR